MERIRPHEQITTYSCGASALLIIYRSLGVECNEANLMVELATGKEGTEWSHLANHACYMGFPIELKIRATYKDLKKDFKRGGILVGYSTNIGGEQFSHACVVSGITDDLIELTDPGIHDEDNPVILTKEQFIANWSIGPDLPGYLLIKPK